MRSSLGDDVTGSCAALRAGIVRACELPCATVINEDGTPEHPLGHPVESALGFRGAAKLLALVRPALQELHSRAMFDDGAVARTGHRRGRRGRQRSGRAPRAGGDARACAGGGGDAERERARVVHFRYQWRAQPGNGMGETARPAGRDLPRAPGQPWLVPGELPWRHRRGKWRGGTLLRGARVRSTVRTRGYGGHPVLLGGPGARCGPGGAVHDALACILTPRPPLLGFDS